MAEKRPPAPDRAERDLITGELDTTLLVEAAAGTGKTTSLIDRMVALVASNKCPVETLAAVTFTRKATAEIRTRFQLALERRAADAVGEERDRLRAAVENVDRCFIGTIHSFCGRLLRERPIEAGVDPAFGELEDDADEELRRRAWREHVADLVATDAPVLKDLEELGLKLSPALKHSNSIVDELEQLGLDPAELGPAFLGCAEYPDVTNWPAPEVELPDLTAIRDELREYARHIRGLGLDTVDHGNDELMDHLLDVARMVRIRGIDEPRNLMDVLAACKKKYVVQKKWPEKNKQAKAERDRWEEFVDRRSALVTAWREHRYEAVVRALRPAIARYDRFRAEANALNFQDLLLKSRDLLRDHPEVRTYFRRRFTHVLVDEFQDTDPVQAEVLFLLAADDPAERDWRRCRPSPGSLFVVGDPKQSIYRFRRADIVTYNLVRDLIVASGGRVVPLTANFRTQRPIVEWVNDCFETLFPSAATDSEPANIPLQVGRSDAPTGAFAGVRRLTVPARCKKVDDAATYEADLIARSIRKAIDDRVLMARTAAQVERSWPTHAVPGDFLVITRKRKRISTYVKALQRLGLPVDVTGGSLLNDTRELGLLHGYLRAISRPDDEIATVAVLRGELFGVADTTLFALKQAGGAFRFTVDLPEKLTDKGRDALAEALGGMRAHARILRREPPVVAIERIAADLGLLASAAAAEDGGIAAGSLLKAFELLRRHGTLSEGVVDAVGRLVDQETAHDGVDILPPDQRPVRVMNLHQCKGLEAPVVFLADPSGVYEHPIELFVDRSGEETVGYVAVHGRKTSKWGPRPLLAHPPDWQARYEAEELRFRRDEEKRLLYVAATRAGNQLVISRLENEKKHESNPWFPFEPFLGSVPEFPDPGPVADVEYETAEFPAAEWDRSVAEIGNRWSRGLAKTYDVRQAKEMAEKTSEKPRSPERDGAAWGTLLHTLLETAMRTPGVDLGGLALSTIEELELDVALVDEALETVESFTTSDLWERATAAEKCLVEVPFTRGLKPSESPDGLPTLVRGVVDLAFREAEGWVLVDYKSERVGETQLPALVDYYRGQLEEYAKAWEAFTGEPVVERGVFFTHTATYRDLEGGTTPR